MTEIFSRYVDVERAAEMQERPSISDGRRDVDKICAFLGYYAAPSGNPLPTFRDKVFFVS
jgi:hypothetical protein